MSKMMKKNDIQAPARMSAAMWIAICGLLLVGVGTLLPILRVDGQLYKYIYCAGALLTLVGRVMIRRKKDVSLRLKRLYRLEVWVGIMFCVGGFFMFYPNPAARDWLAFTLAGGVVQVYASLMIPRQEAKERNGGAL